MFRAAPDAFDLVLADYDMPRMTGTRLALELLELNPDLPVLLMTGVHQAKVMEAEQVGTRGFVIKPFTAVEVGRAIRKALGG